MSELITGTVVGIGKDLITGGVKNHLSRLSKIKVLCNLIRTSEEELIEKELRSDTSNSDYGIEFFNFSEKILLLDYFEIWNGKKLYVGTCSFSEDQRKLEPNTSIKYILMEQDADALNYHCSREKTKKCCVELHTFDRKCIKIKLDVEGLLLSNVAMEDLYAIDE